MGNELERKQVTEIKNRGESYSYEIDLIDLFYIFKKYILFLIIAFIIGGIVGMTYSCLALSPDYKATAKMYLTSTDSIINISDLSLGNTLSADYQELILSRPMLESVAGKLAIPGLTYKSLRKMITLSVPTNTHILEITVTSKDASVSVKAANEIVNYAAVWIPTVITSNAPKIMEEAVESVTVNPNYIMNTLIGALGFAAVVYAIFVLKYILDDSIKSAEELEQFFNITPISSVPNIKKINMIKYANDVAYVSDDNKELDQ